MSHFYRSTRNNEHFVTSKQAIVTGIAPDGGLYVAPELLTPLDVASLASLSYAELAHTILAQLLPDISDQELDRVVRLAYGNQWDDARITPLTPLGDHWMLELYHGPTCAFKDLALQALPHLMSVSRTDPTTNIMIVTATSGDTGKAALEGFSDVPGTGVCVLYPYGKVSDVQRLQMVTQLGSNVAVCALRGTFDDAQTGVKQLFANQELKDRLARSMVFLSSANSINIGRLAPQVCYYFSAYFQLIEQGALNLGDAFDAVVPTGNFGDVLAGYFAKCLGLPLRRLVVASNANKVLTDFLSSGTYDKRRDFITTISPSMDILVSSNLERLLYLASGNDDELVARLMRDLAEKGSYTVPDEVMQAIREHFVGGYANDAATRETIERVWEQQQRVIDPHTAVAECVAYQLRAEGLLGDIPTVVLSTASPYKFSSDVLKALGVDTTGMNGFACMDALERISGTQAPTQLSSLRDSATLHTDICDQQHIAAFVEGACARIFL